MIKLQRYSANPILFPNSAHPWEHDGAFNGSVVKHDDTYHMVYRALSSPMLHEGRQLQVSSIGYANSKDGMAFGEHAQVIKPVEDWEIYGVEDPRVTYFEGSYYIFYTALSVFPFAAYGIKLALAKTTDFTTFEKHPVTTFNSKAMALFPERINGKMAALLTINTDLPPAKIAVAYFDREEDIWNPHYWNEWYEHANPYLIPLLRDLTDQVELGAQPVKTEYGWLVLYSYIKNYMSNNKDFGIEAMLLDLNDPTKVLGRTNYSLLDPERDYELEGVVPNIVFPSGALIHEKELFVYYGAADTRVALARCDLEPLLEELRPKPAPQLVSTLSPDATKFIRFEGNPIITPAAELKWQALSTMNPAAIYLDNKVHIVYRAQSPDGTSVMGYAVSTDGVHIDENLDNPIYGPREQFEKKPHPTGNSGCEDPRLTQIDDRLYMLYTAYDAVNPPRVAMTHISVDDFLKRRWDWATPKLISPPGVDDKDACLVKSRNPHEYLGFHRLGDSIWLDLLNDVDFDDNKVLGGKIIAQPRPDKWDNVKLGIAGPPMETDKGWLLLYHGVSNPDNVYKVGAILLDYKDPTKILGRTDYPIFEPETPYEKVGLVPNVVFPCGSVILDGIIYIYYGGADKVVGVATMPLQSLLDLLTEK